MNQTLFAYGSLQSPEVMEAVTGRRFPSQAAWLREYACHALRGLSYPGIRPQADALTQGVLYSGLLPETFVRLDAFEDEFYVRMQLNVITSDGPYLAHAYVIAPEYYARLDTHLWSYEHFKQFALKDFLAHCRRSMTAFPHSLRTNR